MRKLFILLCTSAFLITSCSKGRDVTFTTDEITITASGPVMEGANTAQGDYNLALQDFLQKNGANIGNISDAKLTKATISMPDSLDSSILSEITLQLAADNADMQKVAVLNPVPEGKKSIDLQVANEQKGVRKLLQQPKIIFVADANSKKDMDGDLVLKGKFEFLITIK